MGKDELILERLDSLERQAQQLTAFAQSIGELRAELAPRLNEAVQALILELADVEADFQIEDLIFLIKKAMRNTRNLSFLMDQLKNLIDFALTAEPLLKSSVPQLIAYVDSLERHGVFRLMTVATEVLRKIGSRYSMEELRQIGEGMVQIVDALKKLTEPTALDLLGRAAGLPAQVDVSRARPVGMFGLLGAMGDPDLRQGLGIVLELTRGLAVLKAQPSSPS